MLPTGVLCPPSPQDTTLSLVLAAACPQKDVTSRVFETQSLVLVEFYLEEEGVN